MTVRVSLFPDGNAHGKILVRATYTNQVALGAHQKDSVITAQELFPETCSLVYAYNSVLEKLEFTVGRTLVGREVEHGD